MEKIAILTALLSCVIALISANYARKSRDIANKANNISIHHDLKPARLAVYNALRKFADYCCKYYTLQCVGVVKGTNDLSNEIADLKWELDSHGPLGMQDVDEKAVIFQKKAWQLQRVLDSFNGKDRSPLDQQYEDIEDNLYGLIDWFGKEKDNLNKLLQFMT